MSSIRVRPNKNALQYVLYWREQDGRQRTQAFNSREDADENTYRSKGAGRLCRACMQFRRQVRRSLSSAVTA